MKTVTVIFLLLLSACAPPSVQNRLQDEDEKSIGTFAVINSTTSEDVLLRLRRPASRGEYSDGRYSYIYTFSDFITRKSPLSVEIRSPDASRFKIATFVFSPDGVLLDWHFDENLRVMQRSKYGNLMDAGSSESHEQGKILLQTFDDIGTGAQSGRVFSECGKPLHAQDFDGMEKWIYGDADDPSVHYYLYFKDNRMHHKYWIRTSPPGGVVLTAHEEAVLSHVD